MKTKSFELINDHDTLIIFDTLMNEDEFKNINEPLKPFNIRTAIISVDLTDQNTGERFSALKPLPYKVKINNGKDRLLKNIDVEILIDSLYWENCTENEKMALLATCLYSLDVVVKKDFPVYNEDGVVKMRLKKPDMIFTGFGEMAKQFEVNSVEHCLWREFLIEFGGCDKMSLRSLEIQKLEDGELAFVHSSKCDRRGFLYVPKDEFSILAVYNDEFIEPSVIEQTFRFLYSTKENKS